MPAAGTMTGAQAVGVAAASLLVMAAMEDTVGLVGIPAVSLVVHTGNRKLPAVPGRRRRPPTFTWRLAIKSTTTNTGLGTVQSVDGSGPHTSVTIDFGSAGTVKLMLIGGVPLEKL